MTLLLFLFAQAQPTIEVGVVTVERRAYWDSEHEIGTIGQEVILITDKKEIHLAYRDWTVEEGRRWRNRLEGSVGRKMVVYGTRPKYVGFWIMWVKDLRPYAGR